MADPVTRAGGGKKEFGGQPWWVWAAGGVALVGGYLYLRHRQAASQAASGAAGTASGQGFVVGGATGLSTAQLLTWISDHQGPPRRRKPVKHCPGDMYWDEDARKCVKEPGKKKHRGKG